MCTQEDTHACLITLAVLDDVMSQNELTTIRCPDFSNGGLNSETFDYRAHICYLNIELFHTLNSNCILLVSINLKSFSIEF